MELIPAIDLLDGLVVRLARGDFERSTEYGGDTVAVALRWVAEGAPRLHIVDLDGARAGHPVQTEVISRVVDSVDVPCQVAGGLRDREAVAAALAMGADRVVLGTAALADPGLVGDLVRGHGAERIVVALDIREGRAVGEGWRHGAASVPLVEAIHALVRAGVERFAVTAIDRDGVLSGPDLAILGLVRATAPDAAVIASGGITTLDDLRSLARLGIEGAILGRALYDGQLALADALAVVATA